METEYRLPEFPEIFGRRFSIDPIPAIGAHDGVIGMAAYSEGAGYIDGEIDLSLALSALWHEAIHVAQIDLHGKPDEKEARWVSLCAHSLLMHNPAILEAYRSMHGNGAKA